MIGSESVPALPRSLVVGGHDRLLRARVAELADREARMGTLRSGDRVQDGTDLVDRLLLVAADLELDECGVPVLRDLGRVSGLERRADVADVRDFRDARDDVRDRRIEGGCRHVASRLWIRTRSRRGLLEARLEDPVHAAGLARPCRSRRCSSCRPMPPSPKATRTKASQPNVAVFQ